MPLQLRTIPYAAFRQSLVGSCLADCLPSPGADLPGVVLLLLHGGDDACPGAGLCGGGGGGGSAAVGGEVWCEEAVRI